MRFHSKAGILLVHGVPLPPSPPTVSIALLSQNTDSFAPGCAYQIVPIPDCGGGLLPPLTHSCHLPTPLHVNRVSAIWYFGLSLHFGVVGCSCGAGLTRRGAEIWPDQATVLTTKGFSLRWGRFRNGESPGHSRKTRRKSSARRACGADTSPFVRCQSLKSGCDQFRLFAPNWTPSCSLLAVLYHLFYRRGRTAQRGRHMWEGEHMADHCRATSASARRVSKQKGKNPDKSRGHGRSKGGAGGSGRLRGSPDSGRRKRSRRRCVPAFPS